MRRVLLFALLLTASFSRAAEKAALPVESIEGAKFAFTGPIGERVARNVDEWLLRAPSANPGMIEMFRLRDRAPKPQLVPWAGEFVGKYLISAIQALRMSDDPRLRAEVERVVRELISTQAADGYLGPFPQKDRLRGNWDLWGHFHCIEALLMWHKQTGDRIALTAARRAGDLVCDTFLNTKLRVIDAGSDEMNMAIITALGHLHRLTGEGRYLAMMREVEKDWERSGDYLRAGLDGREFFASPRPRWESLHDLQGLLELYRITGEQKYRDAFEHHWHSIARNDIHNAGSFSSGEQATGNPYAPGAIETCCTVAWMALSIDMLRLSGDPKVADFLELAFFNGGIGAQHPSGRWWTYNTPMDGVREASAHSIVFQSRHGTPELNCCSVNAPRVLGSLSEWAVMREKEALIINYFGPGAYTIPLDASTKVVFEITGNYPFTPLAKITFKAVPSSPLRIKLRNPGWSAHTSASAKGNSLDSNLRYFDTTQTWRPGDVINLRFVPTIRALPGDREAARKVSVYRGPILLAYDQSLNAFDEDAIPKIDLAKLNDLKVSVITNRAILSHWLEVEIPVANGKSLRLCDYATAGCRGVRYRSWLPVETPLPPPVTTRIPADNSVIGKAGSWFRWSGPNRTNELIHSYRLIIKQSPQEEPGMKDGAFILGHKIEVQPILNNRIKLTEPVFDQFLPDQIYTWEIVAINTAGESTNFTPPARFRFDPGAPFIERPELENVLEGPDGLLIDAPLNGSADPSFGKLEKASFTSAKNRAGLENSAVELNGSQMLVYSLPEFPDGDYSVSVWVNVLEIPPNRLGQIFSAWCAGSDDPLRIVFDSGKLFARIENPGQNSSSPPVALSTNTWRHIAAVKSANRLQLYIDGKKAAETSAPSSLLTNSRAVALGGNPKYSGNEHLRAQFAEFKFFARALSEEEISQLAR